MEITVDANGRAGLTPGLWNPEPTLELPWGAIALMGHAVF